MKQEFLRDVAGHQMTILRDDGLYRHIRFKQPDDSFYFFELITWPGHLTITGDCGTWVFSRVEDMFRFFRKGEKYGPDDLPINPEYWSEKLLAVEHSGRNQDSGCMKYCPELFQKAVKHHFDSYFEFRGPDPDDDDYKKSLAKFENKKAELWQAIEDEVLCAEFEFEAYQKALDFEHDGFEFYDFWESHLRKFKGSFLWNLYAIVWGIQQYDLVKAGQP
ncbi:hypothetical protein GCM10027347_59740 [Larkinella harenae]